MKGIALIRSCALLPILDLLRDVGANRELLLQRAGLRAATLRDPEALVPLHQVSRLLAEASSCERLAAIGFLAGERISLAALGDFGRMLLHCPSLGAAVATAVRLQPLYSSGGRMRLVADGERVWLRQSLDRRIRIGREHAEQFAVMLAIQLIRLTAEPRWRPPEIQLCAAAAPGAERIALLERTWISFRHTSTGLAIPRHLLSRRLSGLAHGSPSRRDLERRLGASAPAIDLPGSIRQLLGTQMRDGYPRVRRIASSVGMSVRTLQRRLREAGVSYSSLLERERFDSALRLLAHSRSTITEVAVQLGYTDLANFSHAFNRWAGTSPSRFRRAM